MRSYISQEHNRREKTTRTRKTHTQGEAKTSHRCQKARHRWQETSTSIFWADDATRYYMTRHGQESHGVSSFPRLTVLQNGSAASITIICATGPHPTDAPSRGTRHRHRHRRASTAVALACRRLDKYRREARAVFFVIDFRSRALKLRTRYTGVGYPPAITSLTSSRLYVPMAFSASATKDIPYQVPGTN